MKQDLYFEFVPTIVRKGSPYLESLNKLIHRLLDSGLMLKWEQQVRYALLHEMLLSVMTRLFTLDEFKNFI
jgi:hypothetical protein